MKALVTGGCGFLGSTIVSQLHEDNVSVRVLALPGEKTDNIDHLDGVEVVRGDVLSRQTCLDACKGMDTVFHAAAIYQSWAPDPSKMYEVNMRGTFNMLESCRRQGVRKTIYTASIVALGRPPKGTMGNERTQYKVWDLDFPYSRSKFHSRMLAQDFAEWGLDVSVVCPGIVCGPNDIAPTPSGKLIIETVKGVPPMSVKGGASYVDVRDAAAVHVLAAQKGGAGETYIAAAHNLTNHDFLNVVSRIANKKQKYLPVPASVARPAVIAMNKAAEITGKEPQISRAFFEYSLQPSFYDNSKSIKQLGASYRPMDETIRDAITYFRRVGRI